MPQIDQLVDATIGHSRMSFLDAFQGYHQIPLALEDQEKNSFCYSYWKLSLQSDALWFEKHRVYLSTNDD